MGSSRGTFIPCDTSLLRGVMCQGKHPHRTNTRPRHRGRYYFGILTASIHCGTTWYDGASDDEPPPAETAPMTPQWSTRLQSQRPQ